MRERRDPKGVVLMQGKAERYKFEKVQVSKTNKKK